MNYLKFTPCLLFPFVLHSNAGASSEDLEDYKDQLEAKISVLQKKLQRINAAQKETADKE